MNRFADSADIEGLTKAIQGGAGGIEDRRIYTDRALQAFGNEGVVQTIKEGMRGADVLTIQTILKTLGLYSGKVDGIFGAGTREAVEIFQKNKNLIVDGIIGYKTLAAIGAIK